MKVFDDEYDYYLPAFLNIYLRTSKNFKNIMGSEDENYLFHEYIHFLEDIFTVYGCSNASKVFNNIKAMYHHVKDKEKENDYILCDEEYDEITKLNNRLFSHYLQEMSETKEISKDVKVNEIKNREKKEIFPSGEEKIIQTYEIFLSDGSNVFLGQHAIMESISHILQKNIYDKDSEKWLLPYDLPYLIWCYYFPNEFQNFNFLELLDVEEVSLQFYNPSEIFIKTLELIRNGEIKLSTNIYIDLKKKWLTENNETIDILYENEINNLIENLKGVLVADIYENYRDWLINIIQNAKKTRMTRNNKPIFSTLYSFFNGKNSTKAFQKIINKLGLPPVINADGVVYINGLLNDTKFDNDKNLEFNICAFFSFMSSLAIFSVYNIAVKENLTEPKCALIEVCNHFNDISDQKTFDTDEKCSSNPESKRICNLFCPFSVVWQTFGLNNMMVF